MSNTSKSTAIPRRRKPPDSGTSTTKARRSRADITSIRDAIYQLLANDHPMTVRQVFYRAVSAGIVDKTEAEYKTTICRLLGRMRRDRQIPFGWIADSTRWMRKPETHHGLESLLEGTARLYRRAIWDDQEDYVEIWLEKDALAGVLYQVTAEWDVPLMVTRGYPSLSYLYEAADAIASKEKPAHLYYFGDYDPSGVDITRAVEAGLREFAPDAEIYFTRVAVTPQQIKKWKLPTRPTKKTDSRSKGFADESVEVDAIEPDQLRKIVRQCIEQHVDNDVLESTQRTEQLERETLNTVAANWRAFEGIGGEYDE